jgi:hypothetical protein
VLITTPAASIEASESLPPARSRIVLVACTKCQQGTNKDLPEPIKSQRGPIKSQREPIKSQREPIKRQGETIKRQFPRDKSSVMQGKLHT